jgi:hypothetical protein
MLKQARHPLLILANNVVANDILLDESIRVWLFRPHTWQDRYAEDCRTVFTMAQACISLCP